MKFPIHNCLFIISLFLFSGCVKENIKAKEDDDKIFDGPISLDLIFYNKTDENGQLDIFSIHPNGSNIRNITNSNDFSEQYPAVSHNAKRIAFTINKKLYHTDIEGKDQVEITGNNAFSTGNFLPQYPKWSHRSNYITIHDGDAQPEMYYIKTDYNIGEETQFTRGFANKADHLALYPAFSRTDNKVCYINYSPSDNVYSLEIGNYKGYNNTEEPKKIYLSESKMATPLFSPDGSSLVFALFSEDHYDICIIDIHGENFSNLTKGAGDNMHPCFSPDGSRVVFASNRDGNYDLFISDVNTYQTTKLTDSPEDDIHPFWN